MCRIVKVSIHDSRIQHTVWAILRSIRSRCLHTKVVEFTFSRLGEKIYKVQIISEHAVPFIRRFYQK